MSNCTTLPSIRPSSQILADGCVQFEFPFINQKHDSRRRHWLSDRSDSKACLLAIGNLKCEIGHTIAAVYDNFVPFCSEDNSVERSELIDLGHVIINELGGVLRSCSFIAIAG